MDTYQGYVKLPRALLGMPLSKQPQLLALFIHLLLNANRETKDWNGIRIERGQFITSLRSLSASCGITVSGVRTALKGLCREGITHVSAHVRTQPQKGISAHVTAQGYTLVTICNFDSYEGSSIDACTRDRTPQKETPASHSAHIGALTKEDNIYILSIITDRRFLSIVQEWVEYKREKKQAFKGKKGLTQFYNRLLDYSGGSPEKARIIVAEAMAANYATIYPLKSPRAGSPSLDTRSRVEIPKYTDGNFKSTF